MGDDLRGMIGTLIVIWATVIGLWGPGPIGALPVPIRVGIIASTAICTIAWLSIQRG